MVEVAAVVFLWALASLVLVLALRVNSLEWELELRLESLRVAAMEFESQMRARESELRLVRSELEMVLGSKSVSVSAQG